MESKRIIVVGATGKQGGALIRALSSPTAPAFHVYALTRNASSAAAQRLQSKPNVSVIEGDVNKPSTIFAAIPGPVYGVFCVTSPDPFKPGSFEEDQAIPLIDASIQHGVHHFIFSSADRGGPGVSEHTPTQVPHFATKLRIEQYLKTTTASAWEKSGDELRQQMLWTILRPVAFYDNIMPGFIGRSYAAMLRQMGDRSIAMVGTQDIGNVAAQAFNEPGEYGMKEFSLVGEQLTFREIQRSFREVVGYDIPETYGLLVTMLRWAIPDFGDTCRFVEDGGYSWDCTDLVKEQRLLDFETWLKDESEFCKT